MCDTSGLEFETRRILQLSVFFFGNTIKTEVLRSAGTYDALYISLHSSVNVSIPDSSRACKASLEMLSIR